MKGRLRIEPILIGLLFLGPLAVAFLAYYGPWKSDLLSPVPNPERTLIDPPRALPRIEVASRSAGLDGAAELRYRWSLIYARIGACEEQCSEHLARLRQVRLALGRDLERVQLVYLHTGSPPAVPDPALLMGRLHDAEGRLVLPVHPSEIEAGRIYIADPLGNLVASYPADAERRALLEDLERLLELSNIG